MPISTSRSFHDIDEFLQILTLLHEGHTNVLNGWVQLEEEFCILNVLPLCSERFLVNLQGIQDVDFYQGPQTPSCLRTIADIYGIHVF